jgi:hypothetical protein
MFRIRLTPVFELGPKGQMSVVSFLAPSVGKDGGFEIKLVSVFYKANSMDGKLV